MSLSYETVLPSSRGGSVRATVECASTATLMALDRCPMRPRVGIPGSYSRRDTAFVVGAQVWYIDARQHDVEAAQPGRLGSGPFRARPQRHGAREDSSVDGARRPCHPGRRRRR